VRRVRESKSARVKLFSVLHCHVSWDLHLLNQTHMSIQVPTITCRRRSRGWMASRGLGAS